MAGFGVASRVEAMTLVIFYAMSSIIGPFAGHHTGDIMGYKDADETWFDFFTGASGRLDGVSLPSVQYGSSLR